ncbi:cyclase family protein [Roseobacter weihaiensis]|uniref:cyclase family protein n=1 Tax=Roseobacter weihaiensis TaxID=2763262 RepID=UPI0029CAB3DA|nr:cyclase family protein [Roseobacter sp. H9]
MGETILDPCAESAPFYEGQASFELTEITFQTSIGTYLDAPTHRFEERRDIAELRLDEVVLDAVVVRISTAKAGEAVTLNSFTLPSDKRGKAVLFHFGWDRHWGTDQSETYPFLGRDVIDAIVEAGAKLVGMDTFNADDRSDPARPAHTEFLSRNILIVENLTNLGDLPDKPFRFFAVPIKAKGAAAMTIRAFAETPGGGIGRANE